MPKSNTKFLLSIFLTAFIDMLGVGIIIPIIPALFYSSDALPIDILNDENYKRWAYCLLMASFSFMQFFGAPILGTLSDKYGRKKILQIAISGISIGYLILGFAILYQNLWLMFASRMFAGFFAGSLSVLFSAISDISDKKDKPKNFALIGTAFGLGFILGPMIGGVLSDKNISNFFSLSTPFFFTFFLTVINLILIQIHFKETLSQKKSDVKLTFNKGVQNIKKAFSSLNLRTLFSITFLATLGFGFFTQFFSVIMYEKFKLSPKEIGLIFGWVGIWLILTQGFLIRIINKHFESVKIVQITMLILGTAIIFLIVPDSIYGILICNVFIAISQGLNSPNLLNIVSSHASSEQQGEIIGINQSMQSLAQFIPPIVVALFGENIVTFPFLFGGMLIIFAWFIFRFFYK